MRVIKTILVGIDYSEYSREAARYAIYLARTVKARLVFLYVVEQHAYLGSGLGPFHPAAVRDFVAQQEDFERNSLETIQHFVGEFDLEGIEAEYCTMSGQPQSEIIRMARERQADLIVVGSHGRTGLSQLLIGSVAEKVVRKASCPVLTVKLTDQPFTFSV